MATLHQSDISSWIRCPSAFKYDRAGLPRRQSSALSYGSVIHHALEVFERMRHSDGVTLQEATQTAVQTFQHFWHPHFIEAICPPVDLWLPRQGYADLRAKGTAAIQEYAKEICTIEEKLLATEFGFQVPIAGTWDDDLGEPHILAGTVDRLALRKHKAKTFVAIDDFKSGKEYRYLRQNLQFTAYCYASTRPEFWTGWRGEDGFGEEMGTELYDKFRIAARRGTWINMRTVKFQNAGWRGPKDYERFAIAVEQLVASWKADIYPLALSGETCQFCEYRDICAGVGVAEDEHGSP